MRVSHPPRSGFTLVEIIIGVAIIGLLTAITIPNFVRARTTARKNTCVNNLRQLDGAKKSWVLEHKKATGDSVADSDITPYLKGRAMPNCPSSGSYTMQVVGADPICTKSADGHTL